ncbi:hypothetical protein BZG36_03274 [Bifiguratus adelaidae]|uniref:Phosphotransferase n=1 Tax=Bifiguratus adelaidae TaxID=1938954 RepID=A0A261XZW6_9FUNG|nr:hypothetical protein BZG36_03274 [Bifiguratus adelaidae]
MAQFTSFQKPSPVQLKVKRPAAVLDTLSAATSAQQEAVDRIGQLFDVSVERLEDISRGFQNEILKGLEEDGQEVMMLPTFVTGYPTGREKGTYLALEISGLDINVCYVRLTGTPSDLSIHQHQYQIPDSFKDEDDFEVLSDYVADCLAEFLEKIEMSSQDLFMYSMAMSIGFPLQQIRLNEGLLKEAAHGFSFRNSIGKEVVSMFHHSFDQKGLNVRIVAIVNDSVCTLLANAYRYPNTRIGIVHDIGTNCSYYERNTHAKKARRTSVSGPSEITSALSSLDLKKSCTEDEIVNTEWGGFDNSRTQLPFTWYDRQLDRLSQKLHFYQFEKMTAGAYLGELVRLVITHLIDLGVLFSGESSPALNASYAFDTTYLYVCEADESPELDDTTFILEKMMGLSDTTLGDRQVVKKVCEIIGTRAAKLVAALTAGALRRIKSDDGVGVPKNGLTITVSGDLYESYPSFHKRMTDTLHLLMDDDLRQKVQVLPIEHSRLVGTCIVAMMVDRQKQENDTQMTL